MLYQDHLVSLSDRTLTLKWYYFPFGSKTIALSDIERIHAISPSLVNGKCRFWGTGSPGIWYALDWKRPWRTTIFRAEVSGQSTDVGFSAQDPDQLSDMFKSEGLLAG